MKRRNPHPCGIQRLAYTEGSLAPTAPVSALLSVFYAGNGTPLLEAPTICLPRFPRRPYTVIRLIVLRSSSS
ncbi:hypothetical protein AB1N83_003571 [Pleurotus pulmonarius]